MKVKEIKRNNETKLSVLRNAFIRLENRDPDPSTQNTGRSEIKTAQEYQTFSREHDKPKLIDTLKASINKRAKIMMNQLNSASTPQNESLNDVTIGENDFKTYILN